MLGIDAIFDEKITYCPIEKLREIRLERLHYTIRYAWGHSPMYRKLMKEANITPEDIKTFDDLRKFPIVTKHTLLSHMNFEDLLNSEYVSAPEELIKRAVHTSGSTTKAGEPAPKIVFLTEDDLRISDKMMCRCLSMAGVGIKSRVMNLYPAGFGLAFVGVKDMIEYYAAFQVTPTSYADLKDIKKYMGWYRINTLIGFPSHLEVMANKLREMDAEKEMSLIKKIIHAGEPYSREREEKLAKMFSDETEVFGWYASNELRSMAAHCEHHNYHLFADWVHVMIIDKKAFLEDGEVEFISDVENPADEEGLSIFTMLLPPGTRCGTVLINYWLGDMFAITDIECECGRRFPVITYPKRGDDVLVLHGAKFDRLVLESVLFGEKFSAYVKDYQVIKSTLPDGKSKLEIKLYVDDAKEFREKGLEEKILEALFEVDYPLRNETLVNRNIVIEIQPTDEPIYKGEGKAKRVIIKE